MKKLLFLLFAACSIAPAFTHAQAPAQQETKVDAPRFKFVEGDVFDFGKVEQGPDVFHEFEFVNTGTQPLVIVDAKPSCSCTTPEWPKEPIPPGGKGKIKVGFHATKAGLFNKEVYIQSNAYIPTGEKRYTIYIKGEVKNKD